MPPNMKLKKLHDTIKLLNEGNTPFLTMYFVFKGNEGPIVRLVDIDKATQDDFANKFKSFLGEN